MSSVAFMMLSFLPCFHRTLFGRNFFHLYVQCNICRHQVFFPILPQKFALRSFSWDQTIRTYLDIPVDQSQRFLLKLLQSYFSLYLPQSSFFFGEGVEPFSKKCDISFWQICQKCKNNGPKTKKNIFSLPSLS